MKNIESKDGIMGLIVGDALGLPVSFLEREELNNSPVKTMIGYGTYNKEPGTFSDDSSLSLATIDSFINYPKIDYDDLMERFRKWHDNGEYTQDKISFDIGNTTLESIEKYKDGEKPLNCGGKGERDNGNGSLMRILPVAYLIGPKEKLEKDDVDKIYKISSLTHDHIRSKIACHIYCQIAVKLLNNMELNKAISEGIDDTINYYKDNKEFLKEKENFKRIINKSIFNKEVNDIKSSGYVIDTLEASIWSLVTTKSYKEALLKCVNLADDADTIGAVTGGLAGIYYGYSKIPKEWLNTIKGKDKILNFLKKFDKIINKN
ncbi:ADP-ribosylglycohydrolase [Methanobrevibacter sp. 87.7]|uniref:ADP-ribosylglycohydrolase family protein n=1 Tax=Methanobrevibacter sp. 87.7 TaxID=387957 RepID=UPI000B506C3A|nr:ADP-ribosylglycohydrolase family protein [Methanobrevibacter sp. 87.7]OWT33160.1 ADP-ribosylglycohydrolase [Methanobrevibacter sp. 87.7]